MRRIPLAAVALLAALLAGCGAADTTPSDTVEVRVASLRGPTTMGLVKLIDDAAGAAAQNHQAAVYTTTVYGTPDEVVPLIVQGRVDVALIPANLAAVLHNKTRGTDAEIAVAAVNTLGVLEVVEAGDTVHRIADLRGRTVYSTGRGATPEYVLNHLLTQNGLAPGEDVAVEFLSEATEVAARLAAEPGAVGLLPQPYVTALQAKQPGVRSALSLTEEWAAVTPDSQLVTGVLVVRRDFAEEHPEALAAFLADYRASTAFANEHPDQAAPLIVAAGIAPDAAVAEAAIPRCSIVYIDGPALREALDGYLRVLFDADPASVGGSVPGDDLYLGG